MERNKKNKKNQTFEVYPYLNQYQYLMRTGGQLPWYVDEGEVDEPFTFTGTGDNPFASYSGPCTSELEAACNERGGTWKKKTINKTGQIPEDTCECEEPENKTVGGGQPEKPDTTGMSKEDATTALAQYEEKLLEWQDKTKDKTGNKTKNETEKEDNNSTEEQKKKALEDYQNGTISKKELENIIGLRHNLGRGLRSGTPNYEITPTSPLGLLATAVDSTYGAIKGTGRRSINPKTGLPYTKADFKETSVNMGKVSNVNKADLYWDDANKADYMKQLNSGVENPINAKTGKPYTQAELLGTKNMHVSNRYEKFKTDRDEIIEGFGEDFNPENKTLFSNYSIDPHTGEKVFADVTTDVEDKEKNPAYIEAIQKIPFNEKLEGHPSLKNIPEYFPITRQVTESYDPNKHKTEFDKVEQHTKDYNVNALTVGENLDVKGMIRETDAKNLEENIKNEKTGEILNNVGYEKYDPTKIYTNYTETNITNNQKEKNKAEAERIAEEGKMGLEMFVYGGQKELDQYQKKGEKKKGEKKKVHDFLKYFTGFPRTGFVPYNGDFTAQQLQSAITRDSTSIENELANNWFLRNFIGQDQTHQSNTGTSGKLQLNREWLHKLLDQSDKSQAKQLNFYRQGGSLPWYQAEGPVEEDQTADLPTKIEYDSDGFPTKKVPDLDPADTEDANTTFEDYNKKGLAPVIGDLDSSNTENANTTFEDYNKAYKGPDCDENNPGCIPENPDGKINPKTGLPYTAEEMAKLPKTITDQEMKDSQQDMSQSGIIDQSYGKGIQGVSNAIKATTKTGLVDRALNTYGDYGQAAYDIANFGEALTSNWQNQAAKTKADTENTTGEDQFMAQGTSQGIYDPNSGDSNTNQKVDEIYSGNTMKAPLIMSQGGQGMAQPVAQNVNYAALAEFTGVNPYNTEISYSPEVIAYQKQIMGKMARGGQLPMAQFGWLDNAKSAASGVYNKAKNVYNNTDFKAPINKALDYSQTAMSAAGMIPIVGNAVDLVNTGVSGARGAYAHATGDKEGVKHHAENAALNLASAVPGAGLVAGGLALSKDAAGYAGMKGSVSTNVANAITNTTTKPAVTTTKPVTTPTKPVATTTAKTSVKTAKRGGEQIFDVDYEILQELIKAGADIEII
jgi:hypothetical protein